MYDVLLHVMRETTAASKVMTYVNTTDAQAAWNDITEYFDSEVVQSNIRNEIYQTILSSRIGNAPRGYVRFLNDFAENCRQLDNSRKGAKLDPLLKKQFLENAVSACTSLDNIRSTSLMVMAVHDKKMTPEEEYQHYFTLLTHQATILDQKPRGSRRVNMHDLLPDTSDVEIIEETSLDEDALQAFKSSQERPAISAVDGVTWKALSTDDQNYFKLISRAGRQAILDEINSQPRFC